MHLRVGWLGVLAATFILTPVPVTAGDGTFGVPPSGVLLPPLPQPAKTAVLFSAGRAAPEKVVPPRRAQQTYSSVPVDGASRSRVVPPSEAPVHSPIVVPPKGKQFRAPTASVDPDYAESVVQGEPRSLSAPSPASAPVVAQGAAPDTDRGLFNMLRARGAPVRTTQVQTAPVGLAPANTASAASAAYQEHAARPIRTAPVAAPPPAVSRWSFGGAKPSARASDGTPCGQLRGIFTSPPECR